MVHWERQVPPHADEDITEQGAKFRRKRLFKPKDPDSYAGLGDARGEEGEMMQTINVSLLEES